MKRYIRSNIAPYRYNEISKQLQDDLYDASIKYLTSKGWDMSDIADYFVIEVESIPEDGRIRVEVRAELGYDGFEMLISKYLDKVVAKYDELAYFDMVEPGIAESFIDVNN